MNQIQTRVFNVLKAVLVTLCCGVLGQVQATSVRAMDLEEMAALSDDIVHARCTGQQIQWRSEKIFTESTFTVLDALKGRRQSITITSLGGTAIHPVLGGPVTMQVAGGLAFKVGDEVVFFSTENRLGQHQVVGMSMGNYAVQTDAKNGTKRVSSSYKELKVESRSSRAVADSLIDTQNMELDAFLQKVREAIATSNKAAAK